MSEMREPSEIRDALSGLLREQYGLEELSLRFLREGGSQTFLAEGRTRYFVKVISPAFAATARRSAAVMRFLEEKGFPVPRTHLTRSGEAMTELPIDGGRRLVTVQEFIEGDEPDLTKRAEDVGELVGRLHVLLDQVPGPLTEHGKPFFIGRYLDFLRRKAYPRLAAYEELGDRLWRQVEDQPQAVCHGDLHRGNLLEDGDGRIHVLDFDTVCRAPSMFDVSVMCDMTDYFRLKEADVETAKTVYERFLEGYLAVRALSTSERRSFGSWVAIRHFQLQATILEIHGIDCVGERFLDAQLDWLDGWLEAARRFEE
ncbi:MAG: phosphotransferase [Clostridia bacterium]|nr:phosphotransferase [Clostridia bacterium]